MFISTLVIDGQVLGTWKRTTRAKSQALTITPFEPLTKAQVQSIDHATKRYADYTRLPTTWAIATK